MATQEWRDRQKIIREKYADVSRLVALSVNEYAAGESDSPSRAAHARWKELGEKQRAAFDAVVARIEAAESRAARAEELLRVARNEWLDSVCDESFEYPDADGAAFARRIDAFLAEKEDGR